MDIVIDITNFDFTGQDLLPRGKGHNRTSRSLTRCPTSPTPHSHTKDTGITLLLYEQCVGPTELSTLKDLGDGTSGLTSLSETTRKSNHMQMKLQRQHFSPQLFKDPECWSGRSLELTTSRVSARCTTKCTTGARWHTTLICLWTCSLKPLCRNIVVHSMLEHLITTLGKYMGVSWTVWIPWELSFTSMLSTSLAA